MILIFILCFQLDRALLDQHMLGHQVPQGLELINNRRPLHTLLHLLQTVTVL